MTMLSCKAISWALFWALGWGGWMLGPRCGCLCDRRRAPLPPSELPYDLGLLSPELISHHSPLSPSPLL